MLTVALIIALLLLCVLGVALTLLQLPGTWLILAATAGYAWYTNWTDIGGVTVGIMAAIAVLAEVIEALTGVWFTRKGGGSRKAAWWGLVGGIAGALLLSVPVPVIGTIIGAVIGCFCGALLAELSLNRDAAHAARVSLLAATGRALGSVLKVAAAIALAGITVVSLILRS